MKDNYRIKKVQHYKSTYYILQKRLLGFLWWYNPDNIDGAITGIYNTLDEATESYKQKTHQDKISYISVIIHKDNNNG